MNAFGRMYFMANYTGSGHKLSCKFNRDEYGSTVTLPTVPFIIPNQWLKVSLSINSIVGSKFNMYLDIFDTNSHTSSQALNNQDFT